MNDNVTRIDFSDDPKTSGALKTSLAEKEAKLLEMKKEAEEYAAKLKKSEAA